MALPKTVRAGAGGERRGLAPAPRGLAHDEAENLTPELAPSYLETLDTALTLIRE